MRKLQFLVVAGVLMANVCFSAGNSRITLNDGTTIYGKVVGMSNGVYSIQTDTMGEININADNVIEISSSSSNNSSKVQMNILDGDPKRRTSSNDFLNSSRDNSDAYAQQQQNVNTRVQSMMMDQNFLNNLTNLGSSPEMQSVLNDEEIMNAIQNGDYDYLMNNSKINDLMNSSGIQDILGDMQ